jgi:hypothetical protein
MTGAICLYGAKGDNLTLHFIFFVLSSAGTGSKITAIIAKDKT